MRGFDYRDIHEVIRLRSKNYPGRMYGIAKAAGMSESTLYDKLSGRSDFKLRELKALDDVLHFSRDEKEAIWR